jgi:hypothetical protein
MLKRNAPSGVAVYDLPAYLAEVMPPSAVAG